METIKSWILNRPWIRQEMYSRVFHQAQDDILETFSGDVVKESEVKAKQIMNDLLSPVDLNYIVSVNRAGLIFIGGLHADDIRLQNLKAEAEAITKFEIWNLLYETPKELAQREMFVSGNNLESMQKGRSILYTLSTQKKIIDTLLSYQQKKPSSISPPTVVE